MLQFSFGTECRREKKITYCGWAYVLQGTDGRAYLHMFACIYIFDDLSYSHRILFRFVNRKHLIDVTEVFRALSAEKKFRLVKLGFYLVLLFIIIFRFVLISSLCMKYFICWSFVMKCVLPSHTPTVLLVSLFF